MATASCAALSSARQACSRCSSAAAMQSPTQDALVCEGRRWSYAQCADEAERIAAGLAAKGMRVGDRVLMFIGNRPEFVFVLLALQRLGAIAVPVGVREQRPGLAYIARQCGAVAIVFDVELAARVPRRRRCAGAGAARGGRRRGRRQPAGLGRRRMRCRRPPRRLPRTDVARDSLHVGHHRAAEGRDAHAPEHRAFGAALPGLHAAGRG